ncbi:helix-turn-helix domain-containing protein [Fusobacterium polymorphum]|uniref:helix-turn-helix domain-containing protein n=1 Tax=Fusobacterium nucleatum subsp. polymorphum TaxID=76857 RepID=UPI00300BCA7A
MNNIEIILKALIKKYSLSQVDLSVKSDIPLPTMRKYLKSEFNPTDKNLKKIEDGFNIDLGIIINNNLNDIENIENIEYELKSSLASISKKVDKLEEDINLYDYVAVNGGLTEEFESQFNFGEMRRIEHYKNIQNRIKNTLDLLKSIKDNLSEDNKKVQNIINLDNNILNILRKNNILIAPENELIQKFFRIDFDNNTYGIKNDILTKLLELLESNFINDFKNFIEIIENNKEKK